MLRVIRSAAVLLAAAACGAAPADELKPSTLTPKEVADGWILLFDGETTFGLTTNGGVRVDGGKLAVGGPLGRTVTTTTAFGSRTGYLRMRYSYQGEKPFTVRWGPEERSVPAVDLGNLGWHPDADAVAPITLDVPPGATLTVERLAFEPTKLTPVFNGKDVSGWKVFAGDPKRSASKWEVTPAGELHVTNGPGDLQTEGKYGDFVLQFECKTNGDGLNSGVFFRCVPDQYQNGYEAQVQNAYLDGDRTRPKDFGTGAIYRRVPARKVVSNDREWFTMTLVAQGPRIATWVNGYQTVDWADDRKPADNPRQGLRTAAGHLSIQGHDPTTDILFRNIRIAELTDKK